MKIALSGHTRGLGKFIYESIHCTGYSRSNGFDITETDLFVQQIKDFDVFINNTYHPIYQQKLFETLFDTWKYKEKIIINIINLSTILEEPFDENNEYFKSKKLFKESIQNILITNRNKKVKVVNLFLGTLEENKNYNRKNKLKYNDVINTLNFILESPRNVEHSFISLGCTTEYQNNII